MKRRILSFAAVAGFAILAFSVLSIAQPVTTGGGLSRVQVEGGGLEGSGTTSNKLRIRDDCGTGSGLTWDGDSWECGAVGGVSDGDKGDITVSASGATFTIDNDAVTYAKIQNVSATDKLLGRSTSGAGDIEEIACTAAGRALLDDADASAQRTTLGLGALATGGDGDKGDITVSSSGATWDVDSGTIGTTELADNLDLSSNGTTKTGNTLGAWISPSAITGTTNDWNPTGLSGARNIYVDLSGNATITGLQGGADGRELTLCNSHATNILTFSNESGSSTAGNRVRMPGGSSWKLYGTTYFAANGQPECGTFVYKGSPIDRWIMKSWASQDMPSLEVLGTLYPATIAGAPNFTTNVTSTGNWTFGNATNDTVMVSGDLTVNDTTHLVGAVTADGNVTLGDAATDTATVTGTLTVLEAVTLGDAYDDNINMVGNLYGLGSTPSLSSCGTSPSIVGNDKVGTITTGTASPSACTLNFSAAWTTNAPICIVQRPLDPGTSLNMTTIAVVSAASTSAITVKFFRADTNASATCQGCEVNYHCIGRL